MRKKTHDSLSKTTKNSIYLKFVVVGNSYNLFLFFRNKKMIRLWHTGRIKSKLLRITREVSKNSSGNLQLKKSLEQIIKLISRLIRASYHVMGVIQSAISDNFTGNLKNFAFGNRIFQNFSHHLKHRKFLLATRTNQIARFSLLNLPCPIRMFEIFCNGLSVIKKFFANFFVMIIKNLKS